MRQILRVVLASGQSVYNRLTNSNKAWNTGSVQLVVTPSEQDITLDVPSTFGKALQVVTTDESNPSHIQRDIPLYEVDNLNHNWYAPNDVAAWGWDVDGSGCTAQRMAVFNLNGIWQVRVLPIPQTNAIYSMLFSVGDWMSTAALADIPILPQHHHFIEVRSAIALLPLCEWHDDSTEEGRAMNSEKRKELAMSLQFEERQYAEDFLHTTQSLRGSKIVRRDSCQGDVW